MEHATGGILVATGPDGSIATFSSREPPSPDPFTTGGTIHVDPAPTDHNMDARQALTPAEMAAQTEQLRNQAIRQHAVEMHRLLVSSAIALGVTALLSIVLGWVVAGRVLSPLRTITATTRAISATDLQARLALSGPDDEIKELGDTIDGLLARLEAAFNAQRRFVANASHELRTPLTMMRTSLDVALGKSQPVPAEVHVLAGKLREGLDQADRLLEGLLVLARAQENGLGDLARVSLDRLIRSALQARGGAIAERSLAVRCSCTQAEVIGSETLLTRLVDNVIDNAVRHNVEGGFIHVTIRTDDHLVRLCVENGGPLLDEHQVKQLGQPFQRLGAARTTSDGSVGLGLSIVNAITAAHRGSLELQARPEGGLSVMVALPRDGRTARADGTV